jgi:predicted dehydrogenase
VTRTPLRIGLIGAGSIAAYHIEGVRAAGDVVQAIATSSQESAEAAVGRFAIPQAYAGWEALVARRDIDAVIVATPDATHEQIALAAIAAGRPVMVQKPLAATSAAALRIAAAGRTAGMPVVTSYMHRHFPETRRWREMVADGSAMTQFGPVLSLRLRNATPGPDWGSWFFDRDLSGGVVAQIGIHGIDLIEHLVAPIRQVAAMTGLRRPERRLADGSTVTATAADHAHALYGLAGGALASHEMCYAEVAGTDRFAMELTCEKAKVAFRGPNGPLAANAGDGWRPIATDATTATEAQHRAWSRMLRGESAHDGSDIAGVQGLLVAEAIRAAAESGAQVGARQAADMLAEAAG